MAGAWSLSDSEEYIAWRRARRLLGLVPLKSPDLVNSVGVGVALGLGSHVLVTSVVHRRDDTV